MKIRSAESRDLPQIIHLCELHADYEKCQFDKNNKEQSLSKHLFNQEHNIQCIVAEEESKIVGYATFMKQFSTWDVHYYIYLDCLYFMEEYRGQGLGSQFMSKIKTYAQSEKCKEIQWQTPDFNTKAIAFYQKLGANSKTKERFFWSVS